MDQAAPARNEGAPRVVAAAGEAALLAAARLALSALLLGAALLAGARTGRALGAFALGAVFLAFAARVDRRSLLLHRDRTAQPLPARARPDPPWRVVLEGLLPSTTGLAVMTAIALATHNPTLGAILAGAVAGLGLAAALAWVEIAALENRERARFYVERGREKRLFATPQRGKRGSTA